MDRTTPKKFEKKIHRFKELLWSGVSPLGKKFYDNKFKCSSCHGEKGNGEGPRASEFKPAPTNFTDASFWMGDVGGKIEKGVTQGKVHKKEKIDLKPEELKAVAAYIKQTFGRYAVYKIIDGNQQPRPSDPNCEKIVVQTYSILQVFNYLAEFIQVPAEHLEQERAIKQSAFFKSLEKVPLQFIIKSSKIHPEDSFVAIQKNDYWFYIDDKDPDSKRVFSGIAGILSLSEPGTKEGTPVLTLPVQ